jgi:predicted type IV restriction endonuclease
MAIKDVEAAIRHGRRVIREFGDGPVLHEAATRYAIIDPILRPLGWKLEDPSSAELRNGEALRMNKRWRITSSATSAGKTSWS